MAARFAGACAEAGLDLTFAFSVGQYNRQAADDQRLFDFGRTDALGVLVGNTRQLWPVFKGALSADPALAADTDPLDRYVTARLGELASRTLSRPFQLVLAHAPPPFPLQRLAEAIGFAALSPSHLAIHPEHGPWLALRAVVLVDVEGPPASGRPVASPCRGCSAPCVPALRHALAVTPTPLSERGIAEHAADWIAIRDACPVGRASRYGEEQLSYHYTKAPLPSDPAAQGS